MPLATLIFAPGETSKSVTVLVNGDTTVEGTERFVVSLSSAADATIIDLEGFGTVTTDDVDALLLGIWNPAHKSLGRFKILKGDSVEHSTCLLLALALLCRTAVQRFSILALAMAVP